MKRFLPFFYLGGVIIAFYTSFLHNVIQISLGYKGKGDNLTDSQVKDLNVKSTYVFIVLGFSETLSGFLSGVILDKF
jgi:hypothetical protein